MKNTYIQQGSTFRAIDTDALGIHERLPVGTYTINETPLGFEIARDRQQRFEMSYEGYAAF